jgi:hypothetical protein
MVDGFESQTTLVWQSRSRSPVPFSCFVARVQSRAVAVTFQVANDLGLGGESSNY